jgi:hypothetical protein
MCLLVPTMSTRVKTDTKLGKVEAAEAAETAHQFAESAVEERQDVEIVCRVYSFFRLVLRSRSLPMTSTHTESMDDLIHFGQMVYIRCTI